MLPILQQFLRRGTIPPAVGGGGGTPALQSITIEDANPTKTVMTYDINIDTGSVSATTCFFVIGDGVTKTATDVAISGATVTVTWSASFYYGESVLMYYIVPTSSPIQAASGGADAAAVSAQAVTNNIAAAGTVYYVDPATGNDTNAGTVQGSPWKTIPGTYEVAGVNRLNSAWGSIDGTPTIAAGSRIRIKAGSAFTSSTGGRCRIDSSFYSEGTAKNPIVIEVADDWGTGDVTWTFTGITVASFTPALWIFGRSGVHIRGTSAARLVLTAVTSSSGYGVAVYNSGDGASHRSNNQLAYITIHDCSAEYGISLGYTDNFVVRDCITYTIGGTNGDGIGVGINDDRNCDGGEFRDCEAYDTAPSGSTASDFAHGYICVGSTNIVYRRCKAHDNKRDGFDLGSSGNDQEVTATYIDCDTYDNGEDGFGCNGGDTTGAPVYQATYINCRSFRNVNGSQPYDGIDARYYHCTFFGNTQRQFFPYSFSTAFPTYTTNLVYRNNYFGRVGMQVQVYTGGSKPPPEYTCDSDRNAWIATTALTDSDFEEPDASAANYNNWTQFGANETKTTTQQAFVDSTNGDFNLANNTGTCHTNGAALSTLPAACRFDGSSTRTSLGRERAATPEFLGAYDYAA